MCSLDSPIWPYVCPLILQTFFNSQALYQINKFCELSWSFHRQGCEEVAIGILWVKLSNRYLVISGKREREGKNVAEYLSPINLSKSILCCPHWLCKMQYWGRWSWVTLHLSTKMSPKVFSYEEQCQWYIDISKLRPPKGYPYDCKTCVKISWEEQCFESLNLQYQDHPVL